MSAIETRVQFAARKFLQLAAGIILDESEPAALVEHRKMTAKTLLAFIDNGNQDALDLGDMALAALARATIDLCGQPHDRATIEAFQAAATAYVEVAEPGQN